MAYIVPGFFFVEEHPENVFGESARAIQKYLRSIGIHCGRVLYGDIDGLTVVELNGIPIMFYDSLKKEVIWFELFGLE